MKLDQFLKLIGVVQTGGEAKMISDYNLNINHKSTPRIQEMHILIGHIICDIVEQYVAGALKPLQIVEQA